MAEGHAIIPQVHPVGPSDASIMIVGEAPGSNEVLKGVPFVGTSGEELSRMLHEAGILRADCFITNVCRVQPPGNDIKHFFLKHTPASRIPGEEIKAGIEMLEREIREVKPNLIIALGETALWALTNERGITKWRGSVLESTLVPGTKVLPTYHPAAILRMWSWRWIAVQDFRRAKKESAFAGIKWPETEFIVRPDFDTVVQCLGRLTKLAASRTDGPRGTTSGETGGMVCPDGTPPTNDLGPSNNRRVHHLPTPAHLRWLDPSLLRLSVDIETRRGHIACIGIAWSSKHALCIPLMCKEDVDGYWSELEEIVIIEMLKALLTHPGVSVIGQNFLYDAQYFAKWYGFIPNVGDDTMIKHHTCWSGMQKGLDFLSSLYCEFHQYWKDEGKEFDLEHHDEERLWVYNCKDAAITFEVNEVLDRVVEDLKMQEPYTFQMRQFYPVLRMMLRGVRVDQKLRDVYALQLLEALASREQWLIEVLGHELNPRSPKQMQALFYGDFQQLVVKNRKTGKPTCDDDALNLLAKREPLLLPLVNCINEIRSVGVFLSTFVLAELDTDKRLRCSYAIAGPETFRYASSKNAFGSGANLQNIPKGNVK